MAAPFTGAMTPLEWCILLPNQQAALVFDSARRAHDYLRQMRLVLGSSLTLALQGRSMTVPGVLRFRNGSTALLLVDDLSSPGAVLRGRRPDWVVFPIDTTFQMCSPAGTLPGSKTVISQAWLGSTTGGATFQGAQSGVFQTGTVYYTQSSQFVGGPANTPSFDPFAGMTPFPAGRGTFHAREYLKRIGGRWDKQRKIWFVPPEHADEARRLIREAEAGRLTSDPAPDDAANTMTCWECGGKVPNREVVSRGGKLGEFYCGCATTHAAGAARRRMPVR